MLAMGVRMAQVTESAPSVEVTGLVKRYGEFEALHGISFRVQPGEIVGFLGPNGAGKSTTMKILTCFMGATSGDARVAGFDVHAQSEQARRRIGYLPESVPLYDEMLVFDYLNFIAEVRGVPRSIRRERIRSVVEMTGLTAMIARPIQELSKGYRQRVGLAQAIIHEPDVVILDEPTGGLDPNQLLDIRDVIKRIGAEKTVIFSTHIMQEVEAVCDRIILINQGSIVADDTVSNLRAQLARQRPGLLVTVNAADHSREHFIQTLSCLNAGPVSVLDERHDGIAELTAHIPCQHIEETRRAIFELAAQGSLNVKRVGPFEPSLEEIFRFFTYKERQEENVEVITRLDKDKAEDNRVEDNIQEREEASDKEEIKES
jgi:ABC-2 type transport system ATP-binding protein